jgi:hypothetical protein
MAKLSIALLVLLSVVVAGGTWVHGFTTLKGTCDTTPHPDTCYTVLSRHNGSYPDSQDPSVDDFAGQAIFEAVPLLMDASSTARDETYLAYRAKGGNLPAAVTDCFWNCSQKLVDASIVLVDSYRGAETLKKAKFADVQAFLTKSKEKHVEWNCDACRSGDEKKKVDEISKGSKLDKFMAVVSFFVDYVLTPRPPAEYLGPKTTLD